MNSKACLPVRPTLFTPEGVSGVSLYVPQDNFTLPCNFVYHLFRFRNMKSQMTTRIIGSRNEVHVDGSKSNPWKAYLRNLDYDFARRPSSARRHIQTELFSFRKEYSDFADCFRNTVKVCAKRQGYNNILVSPDIVALVGAEKQQPPHVDLLKGQVQVVMALTDGAEPTLVFCSDSKEPSYEEALDLLGMQEILASPSKFTAVLKFAPALALPRTRLLAGLVPVLDAAAAVAFEGSKSNNNSKWQAGTMFVGDHTVIHAGPYQAQENGLPPRMVLFTTFTWSDDSSNNEQQQQLQQQQQQYNVSDQYLPAHFIEDKTMPAKRAIELLHEWKEDNPYLSYSNQTQATACATLLASNAMTLPNDIIDKHLATLRR